MLNLSHRKCPRLAGLLLSTAVFWAGCTEPNTYVEPPPPDVTVARPIQQDVTDYLEATGTTSAFERVEIRARVKGFLDEIKFSFGKDVAQDQLLYRIDPRPYKAVLNRALAAKAVAVAEFEDAKAKYDRAVPLAESGAVSREELVERLASQEVARATIKATEAQIDQARLDVDYTQVQSPIKGRIGKTLVDVGNLVGNNEATLLTTVVRYDPIYADFNISELALLEVRSDRNDPDKPRQDIEEVVTLMQLGNEKGFPHVGHLDYADLGVDSSTGTYMLCAVFPNPDLRIFPGLYVRIRIPIDTIEGALLLPEAAIGMDQQGRFALIVNSESVVERRKVTVGPKVGEMLVVSDGVQASDSVVVNGIQQARPGAKVSPQEITLKPPAASEIVSLQAVRPPVIEGNAPTRPTAPGAEPVTEMNDAPAKLPPSDAMPPSAEATSAPGGSSNDAAAPPAPTNASTPQR